MLFNKERLKTLIANILSLCIFSYLRPGSNRHVHNGHRILSPARLPIPPLRHLYLGAENETRTRDPDLGKVVLYQLSYFRKILFQNFAASCHDSAKQTSFDSALAAPRSPQPAFILRLLVTTRQNKQVLILPSLLQEVRNRLSFCGFLSRLGKTNKLDSALAAPRSPPGNYAIHILKNHERKTRLELATPTLARSCSTN